jgi:NAD(P)-dependent dehydrogenase (short-subunit alcohol dehydrogenase family)
MKELHSKVSLVTGGGSGIGRALAIALAAEGSPVVIADIIEANAEAAAREIRERGGRAIGVACDVSERSGVQKMRAAAIQAFGPVSLLFANAGATSLERITEMTESDIDWILDVNLRSVLNCLHTFLPDMIAARQGHVVTTASMAGLLPSWIPSHVPYTAAKAGAIAAMINLREEVSEFGIGVTVLCPGGVKSNMMQTLSYRPARFGGPSQATLSAPERSANIYFRPPEEVAQMVLIAIRENRPMVVTDESRRALFENYADLVYRAFDDAAAFDKALSLAQTGME